MADKDDKIFEDDVKGMLMLIKTSALSRYQFDIWFKYDKNSMNKIKEGTLIGIENFASNANEAKYSIVSVTSVMPIHYAIGETIEGYPGFVEEAAESSSLDWDQEKPIEDTTRIYCKAVPYNMQINTASALGSKKFDPKVEPEENLPMVGRQARIITSPWVEKLYNMALTDRPKDELIAIGKLPKDDLVDILVDWDELVRTHFGIFAYTKAGKSNLLSTCISKMIERANSLKVLVFDIMSEYSVLLMDALCKEKNACVLCLDLDTLPKSVIDYWKSESGSSITKAAKELAKTSLFPAQLKPLKGKFADAYETLLKEKKIKIFLAANTYGPVIERAYKSFSSRPYGAKPDLDDFVTGLIENNENTDITEGQWGRLTGEIQAFQQEHTNVTAGTFASNLNILRSALEKAYENVRDTESIDPELKMQQEDLIKDLMLDKSKSLYVIQSDSDDKLRQTAYQIGDNLLRKRRFEGEDAPATSFIFDEADLFIPQQQAEGFGESGFDESRAIATQIARRGRKFGVGIAIATQRITYLDTSILGQPHTYFVSKLPRKSDREKIQEAFGLSDETMTQTLRFLKGEWLLVSYDATGVEGFPVPVKLPNANDRIAEFIKKY